MGADASTVTPSWHTRASLWITVAIPVVLGACMFVMLRWTWMRWADIVVDFGRELYTPWQLSEGRVLYRDIAAFYGPLSQYFNALVFSVFVPGYRVLVFTNLAILIGLLALLYALLKAVSSRLAATAACIVFILLFAFAQHSAGIVNYNYISPYSHEALHGLALSLLAMYGLMKAQRNWSWWWVALSGFALGLVFLTKPESFLAAAPAVVGGLCLSTWVLRLPARRAIMSLFVFLIAAGVPFIAAWALLCTALPTEFALRSALGSWPFLLDERLTSLPFFKVNMGTDDVGRSIGELLKMTGWWCLAIVPAMLTGLMMRGRGIAPRVIAAIGAACVPAALWVLVHSSPQWANFARPLPLVMLLAAAGTAKSLVRGDRSDAVHQLQLALRLTLLTFAGLLLLKMALFARIAHYGFILAMPATLLTVIIVLDWLPAWVRRCGGSGLPVQAAALIALAMVVHVHLRKMNEYLALRQFELERSVDSMVIDGFRGAPVSAVLSRLTPIVQPGQTLVVLPEGVMINYLLRLENPTGYLTFLPSDFIMFGERSMLDALRTNPPDYIALVHRSTSEYGPQYFGRDYATEFYDWLAQHYESIGLAGQDPFQPGTRFGVRVMKRIDQ